MMLSSESFKAKYGIYPVSKVYSIAQIEYIVDLILRKYNINRAYLYGDYAKNKAKENSAVGLDLLKGKNSPQLPALKLELTKALKKEVSLKDMLHDKDKDKMLIYRRHSRPLSY